MEPAIDVSVEDLDRYRDLNGLLDDALALPVDERGPWLRQLSRRQLPLEPLLRSMLARAAVDTGSFMQSSAALSALRSMENVTPLDAPGQCVGPYRLLREIGRGGMAVVWLAERSDGVPRRKVALKLPLDFTRSAAIDDRMARERDILATLEHPHIARLYDAGFAEKGRPYLAMEFVDGVAIDVYARGLGSDIAARLRLMLQVMSAVAHAHAVGVLHNDLKPANVLVDRIGRVRLLDFGVADLLYAHAHGQRPSTVVGVRDCTPAYASPEQTRGEPLSVASDIYALGVVLYELLFGQLPRRPGSGTSSRGGEFADSTDLSAANEPVRDRLLARSPRGDLVAILSTALHEEVAGRYSSVEQFASDLGRCLDGDPVLACCNSARSCWYRSVRRCFDKRLATAALLGALVGVAGCFAWLDGDNARFAPPTAGQIAGSALGCPDLVGGCVVLESFSTFSSALHPFRWAPPFAEP